MALTVKKKVTNPSAKRPTAAVEEAVEEVDGDVEEVAAAPAKPIPTVAATPAERKDWALFACTREISPAPSIGKFNIGHELKITKMAAGANYRLPLHIAQGLQDAKAGVVLTSDK